MNPDAQLDMLQQDYDRLEAERDRLLAENARLADGVARLRELCGRAVSAEACSPGERSAKLVSAERWLREAVADADCDYPFAYEAEAIAAELDRLRARERQLSGEVARLRELCSKAAGVCRIYNYGPLCAALEAAAKG